MSETRKLQQIFKTHSEMFQMYIHIILDQLLLKIFTQCTRDWNYKRRLSPDSEQDYGTAFRTI